MKAEGWGEKWEVRVKIVTTVLAAFMIISFNNPWFILIVFLQSLLLLLSMNFKFLFIMRKLLLPLPFLVFMGFPLLIGPGFNITLEHVSFVALIIGKSLSVFLFMLVLIYTEKNQGLIWGLKHLRVPKTICSVLFISFRYLFLFKETLKNFSNSMVSRGFSPKANLKTFKIYGEVIGTILLKSIYQSERLYKSMKSRGFSKELFCPPPKKIIYKDWLIGFGIIANLLILILIEKW